jgi:hypothetical protein
MSDLQRLIEAVEVVMDPGLFYCVPQSMADMAETIVSAHYGSLDAALRLHEAMLPGWHVSMDDGQGQDRPFAAVMPPVAKSTVLGTGEFDNAEGEASTMARAWLLAILRALAKREEG